MGELHRWWTLRRIRSVGAGPVAGSRQHVRPRPDDEHPIAWARAWTSRDGRWNWLLAARHRDFVVLTDHRLLLYSCGFFTRRPRRCVFDEMLHGLEVDAIGSTHAAPTHLRLSGWRGRPLRLDFGRDDVGPNARHRPHRAGRDGAERRTHLGGGSMPIVIAIDAGTTGVRAFAVDEHGMPARVVVPRVPAALPAAGLGRARRRGHLARHARDARRGRRARSRRWARPSSRSASRISARRPWSGTGAPAHRCIARSSGRTGAPRNAATSCAPRATSR